MYLGIDSSTQSISALILSENGEIIADHSVNFGARLPQFLSPSGFIPDGKDGEVHADPRMWLEALDLLLGELAEKTDLSQVRTISGSGQQHGSVYLDATFEKLLSSLDKNKGLSEQISPALTRASSPIWMDTSTGAQCQQIAEASGGNAEVCRITGSVAVERFTGPQIRRFSQNSPEKYEATSYIHLVSSFLCSVFAGKSASLDYGDGAGMNLMNLAGLCWDETMLGATASNLKAKLPTLAAAGSLVGEISSYFVQRYGFSAACRVGVFTGDNPASLVGMGATTPGQVVISLGTSDTLFAGMSAPHTDPRGFGHVFGNPGGGFMCLVCFRNGSLAREAMRDELRVGWAAFEVEALKATPPGNEGNVMLPFYGAEITPRRDFDGPVRQGSAAFMAGENPAAQIRALLEGQFMNMKHHTDWIGITPASIRLTGGASKNDGIAQIVADVFQAPVERLEIANSAALGASILAAVTDGRSMTEMQALACRCSAGSLLTPSENSAGVHQIGSFISLLG
jgi:xylulokinase